LLNSHEIALRLEWILPQVQKPGRYVGGEYNQISKDWQAVATRVALAFPDIYDIGLPNLGLAIFYEQLNARPDVLAERVYCPWIDMEAHMRAEQIPLFSLESQRPILDFDILAFTLPYGDVVHQRAQPARSGRHPAEIKPTRRPSPAGDCRRPCLLQPRTDGRIRMAPRGSPDNAVGTGNDVDVEVPVDFHGRKDHHVELVDHANPY